MVLLITQPLTTGICMNNHTWPLQRFSSERSSGCVNVPAGWWKTIIPTKVALVTANINIIISPVQQQSAKFKAQDEIYHCALILSTARPTVQEELQQRKRTVEELDLGGRVSIRLDGADTICICTAITTHNVGRFIYGINTGADGRNWNNKSKLPSDLGLVPAERIYDCVWLIWTHIESLFAI